MAKKLLISIVAAVVCILGLLQGLVLFSRQNMPVGGTEGTAIGVEGTFLLNDICLVGRRMFCVGSNKPGIFEIRDRLVVPFQVGYGIGEGRFRGPVRLKQLNGNLYALDAPNRQVLSFDTSGQFLGAFPKRNSLDFLFLEEKDRDFIVTDFCITEFLFIVAYGKAGNYNLYTFNRSTGKVKIVPIQFSLISRIACLSKESLIYVADADNRTVYLVDFKGGIVASAGLNGEVPFAFDNIEDLAVGTNGKVYLLDVRIGGKTSEAAKGALHVFSKELVYNTSLFVDSEKPVSPRLKAFFLDPVQERLLVTDIFASQVYKVDLGE